jgi:hypothetical protein
MELETAGNGGNFLISNCIVSIIFSHSLRPIGD